MRALIYEGPKLMNVREVERPELLENEVLIEVAYSGICGSELSGFLGHNSLRKPPMIFGHEFAGTIAEVGSKVTKLTIGARVTANPLVTCGSCDNCLCGKQQLCLERKLLSAALPGSNAQFVKIPAQFVHTLPDHVTYEQGTFVEPLACGVRAAELAEISPDQRVLIIGLGPIGLFAMQAMQAHGVKHIIAVDRNPERLAIAAELGAIPLHASEVDVKEEVRRITNGAGVHVAVDAVGAGVTRTQCIECVTFGGKVILTGLHEAESSLPINHMIRSEIVCAGAFAYSASNFKTALQWIADGRIIMKEEWIVRAPFEEAANWYDRLISDPGKVAKVLLYP